MRILVIAKHICCPDTASGDNRLMWILRSLREFAEVDYLIPTREPAATHPHFRYWTALRDIGVRPVDPVFYSRVELLCRSVRYDWIMVEFWHAAEDVIDALKHVRLRHRAPRLAVDSVDVHYLRERAALQYDPSVGSDEEVQSRQDREIAVYRSADLVMACSSDDAQALDTDVGVRNVVLISNFIEPRDRPQTERQQELLFVGGFGHRPNVDAICWFADEVMPRVLSVCPEAVLNIVGSRVTESVRKLDARPGVRVVGFVESTDEWLDSAAVSVAPLRYGAGMKGKVTEALSAGVPIVTTTIGAQGLNAVSGTHLHIADNPQSFADAIVRCLQDQPAAEEMGKRGRQLISAICSAETLKGRLQASLTPAEESTSGPAGLIDGLRRLPAFLHCLAIRLRNRIRPE